MTESSLGVMMGLFPIGKRVPLAHPQLGGEMGGKWAPNFCLKQPVKNLLPPGPEQLLAV